MIPVAYNMRSLARPQDDDGRRRARHRARRLRASPSVMMLSAGIKQATARAADPNVAIVLRTGSRRRDVERHRRDRASASSLAAPGVAQRRDGRPRAIGELVVVVLLDKIGGGVLERRPPRRHGRRAGVPPEVKIIEGARATPGTDEVIVGKRDPRSLQGARTSASRSTCARTGRCTIVGVFEDNGSAFESEVWGDMNVIRATFGRQGIVSSVRVRLESPEKFDGFKASIESNRQLNVDGDERQRVLREVVAGDGEVHVGARVHHRVLLLGRGHHRGHDTPYGQSR